MERSARALEAAGVGGWELDIASGQRSWTPVTFMILDLDPGSPPPTFDVVLGFFTPEARPQIERALAAGIESGTPWDLELSLITAKGRHIWVRCCGRAILEAGRTVRLTGALQDITERRKIAETVERLSLVARQMTNAVIITNAEGRTEWVNKAFCRLSGYTSNDMRGRKPGELLQGADTDQATVSLMRDRLTRGEGFEVEIVNYNRCGEPFWISITCTPLRDKAKRLTGFISVASDVTARRRAEDELRNEALERHRAEALLRDILDAQASAVIVYDPAEKLILVNRAAGEMFPILAGFATPGIKFEDLIRLGVAHGQFPQAGATDLEREQWVGAFVAGSRAANGVRTLALPDGRFALARERRSKNGNLVCVRSDATDLKRAEAKLRFLAERDPLTALANRSAFLVGLERALGPGPDGASPGGALIMFDIDRFKQINDTLGHDIGDALLIEIADRLRDHVRPGDIAARLGGDEFAVVMPGLVDARAVAARMDAMQDRLSAPVEAGGRRLTITVSAGVTVFPGDATQAGRLLKNADLALYEAKRSGRACWRAFRPDLGHALERRVGLVDALRRALTDGGIEVALVPKRLLRGGHAGFDTVARWRDGMKWVPPTTFIGAADDAGLAVPLGCAIMEAGLTRIRMLRDRGYDPGHVAITVSARCVLEQSFLDATRASLRRHGLIPADLELAIPGTLLQGRSADRVEGALRDIRTLGVTLALDDLGMGFAALAQLCRLPIDRLKIGPSFIHEIGEIAAGGVMVKAVIGLARSLELPCVAEGVETPAQMAFLAAAGCDAAQGDLIARPMPSLAEAVEYLAAEGLVLPRPPRTSVRNAS